MSIQKKKQRVVHLTSVHVPFDTRIFYKQMKSLTKVGYEVVLIAVHSRDEIVENIRIRAVPTPRNRFERMFYTGFRVIWSALQENADIYHIHDPELLIWSLILRLRGKLVIFDMHENVPKDILSKPWIHPAVRYPISLVYRLLERVLLWRMPVIFAEHSYKRDYQWIHHQNTVILNTPLVDTLLAVSETPYAKPTVGFIGGVNTDRGSMITLSALAHLKQSDFIVEFDCIGPVNEIHRAELEAFIKTHRLEGIRLHGYMLPSEGYRIIARCHIGLAVLMPVPNAVSSYPTKMFEYMALGLPVIASGFPLYREVIESAECGLCLNDPTNPHELAEAIRWLIEHPQEAEMMGRRGREAVIKHYNWEAEAKKLCVFYEGLGVKG